MKAWLFLRSLAWTVLIPGVVAGYIPWRFFGVSRAEPSAGAPLDRLGLLLAAVGICLLLACIWTFASRGRGTLSPADPPRRLVVRGPYRMVRNPMYLAVSLILLGEVLVTRSVPLLGYWAAWFGLVNLLVLGYEEPSLRRRFGDEYTEYAAKVGRWWPGRRRARRSPPSP